MPHLFATILQSLPGWLAQPEAGLQWLTHPFVDHLLPGRLVRPEAKLHPLWEAASPAARGGRGREETRDRF
jgi:hypothetical protein